MIIVFSITIVGFVIFMTLRNTEELKGILEESIEAQLISTSIAARGLLDPGKFEAYETYGDIADDLENYNQTLLELRALCSQTGAEYIYALKLIGDKYYFIFDTDEEDETLFQEYEIYPVHEQAFMGIESAGIMNVSDEYGSFNTGAVPILSSDGRIVGIISTDIQDKYVSETKEAARRNTVSLITTIVISMAAMISIVALLLRNVRKMQDKLYSMANYDSLTSLPNRQYLMSYLPIAADKSFKKDIPFALFLIDLDNFKKVNDNSGHEAGDNLLKNIGAFLSGVFEDPKPTKQSNGIMNVSARIGGDEFVQIIPGIGTEEEAAEFANKVFEKFKSLAMRDANVVKYKIGMSIGVALFPLHTKNYNQLIRFADLAMYFAKKGGKNTFSIYNGEMDNENAAARKPPAADRRRNRTEKHAETEPAD